MSQNVLISIKGIEGLFAPCLIREENGTMIIEVEKYAKHCGKCEQNLPLSDFGLNNARADKLNPYCRSCVNATSSARREARRQVKDCERKRCVPTFPVWRLNLPPREAVLLAIQRGASDQEAIRQMTRLDPDPLTDALADLYAEDKLDRSALKRREYRMAA